jgi:hypothetical protein
MADCPAEERTVVDISEYGICGPGFFQMPPSKMNWIHHLMKCPWCQT